MFFRYLQIWNALQTQFLAAVPQLDPNPVMGAIKNLDPKKLNLVFYSMLLFPSSSRLAYQFKLRWERDVGTLEEEEWSDTCKIVSPKPSHCLTQLYILHRSYLTPLRLARYKSDHSTMCPMCSHDMGRFYHLLWKCPAIQGFWSQIVQFLHNTMGSPLTLHSKPCLLGIFPEPDIDKFTKAFSHDTLFSARKRIARQWMKTVPPGFNTWLLEVNNTLPYKKFLDIHRVYTHYYFLFYVDLGLVIASVYKG